MCKQYVYFSLCLNRDCDSTVGKKGRNKYCCAARHGARRLGSCDSGVEFIVIEHYRGILFCDECKKLRALHQLPFASSTAAKRKGGSAPSTTGTTATATEEGDGGISDDFSSETIEGEDGEAEEAPGSLRFFANKKIKIEKLASAFNFDLALQQEITAQNIDSLDVDDPGEGDDLFVVSGKDDSTIEYEDKVPEPTRCKNQPTPKIYYGFDAAEVGESPKKFPRLNPQCAPAHRGLMMTGTRQRTPEKSSTTPLELETRRRIGNK